MAPLSLVGAGRRESSGIIFGDLRLPSAAELTDCGSRPASSGATTRPLRGLAASRREASGPRRGRASSVASSASNYTEIRGLGKGTFGAAALARRSADGRLCVVKTVDIRRLGKREQQSAVEEAAVLASLKHPYIVRYHESYLHEGNLCIVMDYAEGGDLQRRIVRARETGSLFEEKQILRWFAQALLGLQYLHGQRILHRDMKSNNLLLTKSGDVRLGDFGTAVRMPEDQQGALRSIAGGSLRESPSSLVGTPAYLSPEIFSDGKYSFASDVWALGIILYELAWLRLPFEAATFHALAGKVTRGPAPPLPPHLPYAADLRAMCKDMLKQEPVLRPSCADLSQRPLIQAELGRMLSTVNGKAATDVTAASTAPASEASSAAPTGRLAEAKSEEAEEAPLSEASTAASVTSSAAEASAGGKEESPTATLRGAADQPTKAEQQEPPCAVASPRKGAGLAAAMAGSPASALRAGDGMLRRSSSAGTLRRNCFGAAEQPLKKPAAPADMLPYGRDEVRGGSRCPRAADVDRLMRRNICGGVGGRGGAAPWQSRHGGGAAAVAMRRDRMSAAGRSSRPGSASGARR
eukprot:TRINITY_DN20203_c0_g1_i1.p1 TRINITY_DN20203_c0_g1~~TRINITY_DN20203_c0_g1_i1.p1  ORF type:complete len:581 (+),score=113.09 TRINITY_DN20203_c0_g1_i1:82-1824(+)